MKFRILFLLLFTTHFSIAQDGFKLLNQAREKCKSVDMGTLHFTKQMKFMTNDDTMVTQYRYHFRKINDGYTHFHYQSQSTLESGIWMNEILYNGDQLITIYNDDTAIVMNTTEWQDEAESSLNSKKLYTPLTDPKITPLNNDGQSDIKDLGIETIGNYTTHHLQAFKTIQDKKATFGIRVLSTQHDYWINTEDSVPVRYAIRYVLLDNQDTVIQFEQNTLNSYTLGTVNDSVFQLSSIPDSVIHVPFKPYEWPELLKEGTLAPDWTLSTTSGDSLTLSSLKGKIVLLDFFYTSCGPCIGAIPGLNDMHQSFHDKGLIVIGVDPYDTLPELTEFIEKREIRYTVVMDRKRMNKAYRVSGYPTAYVLDREGRIIHTKVGYSKKSMKKLRRFIKKQLRQKE